MLIPRESVMRQAASPFRASNPTNLKRVRVLLCIALGLSASGCVKVAAYQRGTLALPSMTTEDVSIGIDGHVRGVSEGAAGGLSGGGGGCGCN